MPVWNFLGRVIHLTNNEPASKPIIIAVMNGPMFADQLEELRPGWKKNRTYPTILFKKSGTEQEYSKEKGRTVEDLSLALGDFFDDISLKPVPAEKLSSLMKAKKPEFAFLYSDQGSVVPRFAKCINFPFLDVPEGNEIAIGFFLRHTKLAAKGIALAVNKMDRSDLPIPAIVDFVDGQEYRYGSLFRWLREHDK